FTIGSNPIALRRWRTSGSFMTWLISEFSLPMIASAVFAGAKNATQEPEKDLGEPISPVGGTVGPGRMGGGARKTDPAQAALDDLRRHGRQRNHARVDMVADRRLPRRRPAGEWNVHGLHL